MGHSFEHSLQGLPHSFLLFKGSNILSLPPKAIKAPKGHKNLQKKRSIKTPINNKINKFQFFI